MSAAPAVFYLDAFGGPLAAADLAALEARWITPELATAAQLRRVDAATGRALTGQKRGDYSGIVLPYLRPDGEVSGYYRIRRDCPDLELHAGNTTKMSRKYVGPPGATNRLYFAPGATKEQTADVNLPVLIVEGEFKALAAARLAVHNTEAPRFLSIGIGGVWNWRGIIGKEGGPNGERLTVKGAIPDFDGIAWKGRRVAVAFDADARENSKVLAARKALCEELGARGAMLAILEWPKDEGKGLDDRLANVGPEKVLAELAALEYEKAVGWKARLKRSASTGAAKALLLNAVIALTESDEWRGRLAYDEMAMRPFAVEPVPIPAPPLGQHWGEDEILAVTLWLQRNGVEVGVEVAKLAIRSAAMENRVHPVRDYLNGLRWDGEGRVDGFLSRYCGVESSNYACAVSRAWLISCVARIFDPGCKADCVLVLEGRQGLGKSRALRALAGSRYFTDHLPDLASKDAMLQLSGVWILEHSEMDSLSRAESAAVKNFLSRQSDRYRAPFGVTAEDHPRQTVFAASVNRDDWNSDETGARRFWPVRCAGALDVAGIEADRDQIWAEAVALYRDGLPWWIEDSSIVVEAEAEQAARFCADPWQNLIQRWLIGRESANVEDVLERCIDKPKSAWMQSDKIRVARCFRALGWERKQIRTESGREWRYQKEN